MSGERNGLEEREEQLRVGGDVRLVVPAAPEYLRLVRLTAARRPEERLVLGPRGGVITTATLRDATG